MINKTTENEGITWQSFTFDPIAKKMVCLGFVNREQRTFCQTRWTLKLQNQVEELLPCIGNKIAIKEYLGHIDHPMVHGLIRS